MRARMFGSVLCLTAVSLSTIAVGQGRPNIRNAVRQGFGRPQFRPNKQKLLQPNKEVLQLIRRMNHPSASYSGEQVTEVTSRGGRTSHQHIWGDARGRVRRDFTAPQELIGDTMLTSADQFRYFHKKTNTLDIALWPTPFESDKMLPDLIQHGRVSVARVGQEIVAGRNAEIVAVTYGGDGFRKEAKFWIDAETGVRLKQEVTGASGLISRSYLVSVQFNASTDGEKKLFEPNFGTAKTNPLFPPTSHFRTIDEARGAVGFNPVVPSNVPTGFNLDGIWAFPGRGPRGGGEGSLLLRYSDGAENFSLYQRRAKPAMAERKIPRVGKRSQLKWVVGSGDGSVEVVYLGRLAPGVAQKLVESLK